MLKAQIVDPMVLILIGAAALSAILQEWTEAAVIFIIVIVNAVIGIVQEKKAQSSLEALRNMSAPTAKVLRQGEESVIPASELVVGDIVMLGDGDMVPADLRLIDSANLKVQEASLTGESVPSEKEAEDILPEDCPLGDRSNMAYTSAIVTYGRATGVVVATGMDTEVGNIAGMLDNQDDTDTPLKRKLNAVGKTLTIVGLIVCALIFAIGAFYQRPLIPQFLVAISLAISIIPEGLPATATIVMALGVQRMAKKNALIRKLPAVETLGSATVICSDKTGTLTLNKMTVTHIAVNGDFENGTTTPIENAAKQHPAVYKELVYAAALCNDASLDPDRKGEIIGDPTEGALIYMAQAFGIDHEALEDEYPRFFEQPFDSERKRMTTVHRMGEKWISYTKGAVDEMLPLCTHILTSEGVRPITETDKENITKLCLSMSENALRVLGFTMRTLTELPTDDDENVEFDMTFVGVTGMIDPPRKEVADSVRTCRQAGIRTIMITGDHIQHLELSEQVHQPVPGRGARKADDALCPGAHLHQRFEPLAVPVFEGRKLVHHDGVKLKRHIFHHPLDILPIDDVDVRIPSECIQPFFFRTNRHGIADVFQMVPLFNLLGPGIPRHPQRCDHQNAGNLEVVKQQVIQGRQRDCRLAKTHIKQYGGDLVCFNVLDGILDLSISV